MSLASSSCVNFGKFYISSKTLSILPLRTHYPNPSRPSNAPTTLSAHVKQAAPIPISLRTAVNLPPLTTLFAKEGGGGGWKGYLCLFCMFMRCCCFSVDVSVLSIYLLSCFCFLCFGLWLFIPLPHFL